MSKEENNEKVLGPTKFAGKKKKKKSSAPQKDPKISKQNHDLKAKIKNLQKEIDRIGDGDQKTVKELEQKMQKLKKVHLEIFKKS